MGYDLSKAVIPAAGLGSRLYPLTKGKPKELLLLGQRPMIRWCIEEAFQSGIQEIAIILNRDKKSIRDYLASPKNDGLDEEGALFQEALNRCLLTFIEQRTPRGSGEAIYLSRTFVGEEPFAVMMPDFVLFGSPPALKQMATAVGEGGRSALGFLRLGWAEARTFGNVGVLETEKVEGRVHQVLHLSDKRPGPLILKRGSCALKAAGRLILNSDYFESFDALPWEGMTELDDVPVVQRLITEKGLLGIQLQGRGFDVGNPRGFCAANEYLKRQARS